MAQGPLRHRFRASQQSDFAAYLRADAANRGWHYAQATPAEDRQFGIDDWLDLPHEGIVSVDWKTDHRAAVTGNLAVEIIANATSGRLGWVFTSQADYIVYLLPVPSRLLWFKAQALRQAVLEWQAIYPTRGAQNDSRNARFLYTTFSLTVPLFEMEMLADATKPQSLTLPPLDCRCASCLSARAALSPLTQKPAAGRSVPLLAGSDSDLV